jgi:hypothetical protein
MLGSHIIWIIYDYDHDPNTSERGLHEPILKYDLQNIVMKENINHIDFFEIMLHLGYGKSSSYYYYYYLPNDWEKC